MNKRGDKSVVGRILSVSLVVVIIILITYAVFKSQNQNLAGSRNQNILNYGLASEEIKIDWDGALGKFLKWFIIGSGVDQSVLEHITVSNFIILVVVWIIFALAFMDIFSTYGLFGSKYIGGGIGILIAVILANLSVYFRLLVGLMNIFSFLAGAAVIVSFLIILGAAFGAHLGLKGIVGWLARRRAAMEVARGKETISKAAEAVKQMAGFEERISSK